MVIEARQLTLENAPEISRWCGGLYRRIYNERTDRTDVWIDVRIDEDTFIKISEGDWIIEHDDHWDTGTDEYYRQEYLGEK